MTADNRSKSRVSWLTVPEFFRLDAACVPLRDAFGPSVYLVGSVMSRPDYRDVDVSLMLPDEVHRLMFANEYANMLLNAAVSEWLSRGTGLKIDFKFQDTTQTNEDHSGPRNPMGIRGETCNQKKA